ncbi:hypothetical protein EVAR_54475_1 [Eumeta japonica]|uniref:Uncharacterized protein n=1 Tax=Eumeta variegata TaxID=151549 RepID=A0A4C1YXP4_EUMVA|nr:hypothetical protein EVAR_54475_1 [Eumeta japonica]
MATTTVISPRPALNRRLKVQALQPKIGKLREDMPRHYPTAGLSIPDIRHIISKRANSSRRGSFREAFSLISSFRIKPFQRFGFMKIKPDARLKLPPNRPEVPKSFQRLKLDNSRLVLCFKLDILRLSLPGDENGSSLNVDFTS